MQIKAVAPFPYAGKTVAVGQVLTVADKLARLLIAKRKAVADNSPPSHARTHADHAEHAAESEHAPKRGRGKYRTRDLSAED